MGTGMKLFDEVPDYHQKLVPVAKIEGHTTWFLCDGAHFKQELPDPYIQHAITTRV